MPMTCKLKTLIVGVGKKELIIQVDQHYKSFGLQKTINIQTHHEQEHTNLSSQKRWLFSLHVVNMFQLW